MDIPAIVKNIMIFRSAVGEWLLPNLVWFKIAAVILSGLFAWGVIYIWKKVDYFNKKIEQLMDKYHIGDVMRRQLLKKWKGIRKNISSANADWKTAVSEADEMLNEILKMSGYLGMDMDKKFKLIKPEDLPSLAEVKNAHSLASRIAADPEAELAKEEAIAALKAYKKAFIELNLLEE